jgi:hypothetical protein
MIASDLIYLYTYPSHLVAPRGLLIISRGLLCHLLYRMKFEYSGATGRLDDDILLTLLDLANLGPLGLV